MQNVTAPIPTPPWWLTGIAGSTFCFVALLATASGYRLWKGTPTTNSQPSEASAVSEPPEVTIPAPAPPPQLSVVRKHAKFDFSAVRALPREGAIVDRLPAGVVVRITHREGDWFQIVYESIGETRVGWTHQANLVTTAAQAP